MASLVLVDGPDRKKYLPLKGGILVVGRDEALPMQILDERVSRKHLRLRFDEDQKQYLARDMGSRSGTYINHAKLEGEEEIALQDRDRIVVGGTTLVFMDRDFPNIESALSESKKAGERGRMTNFE